MCVPNILVGTHMKYRANMVRPRFLVIFQLNDAIATTMATTISKSTTRDSTRPSACTITPQLQLKMTERQERRRKRHRQPKHTGRQSKVEET